MSVSHDFLRIHPGGRLTRRNGVLANRAALNEDGVGDESSHPTVNAIAVEENDVLFALRHDVIVELLGTKR